MLFPPIDPNERFRQRRASARRRKRLRRSALIAVLLALVALFGLGAQLVGGDEPDPASGDLEQEGLTAIELDVKDENGEIGFTSTSLKLAKQVGATRDFYRAREAAKLVHQRGLYLIGRIVVFEDPMLSHGRPELAVQRSDGSVWEDGAGLGWANPYDPRVWDYNVDIAEVAARNGFDEIMFDYVRFPSDGDVDSAVYRNQGKLERRDVIPSFFPYAQRPLEPLGVRVSAAGV